jgi:hypothetical protein
MSERRALVGGLITVAALVLGASAIAGKFVAQEQQIAELHQQMESMAATAAEREAELRHEIVVLTDQKDALELDVAMLKEENIALTEELAYLHYVLDDPMALFSDKLIELTPEEEQLLMDIAMAEAGNQGVLGKMIVIRCVLNRCEATGGSIHGIIYAPNQFYVAGMGGHDEECELALLLVCAGWDGSQGVKYFCSAGGYNAYGEPKFRYRDHWFSA